ncbi:hypothetical protein DICPUDRAFT_157024 [Dictyostelium purpureum]|uniref:THH1/TOM1/TOM3 domain-containing protein n=1 Tax=Dictyostelium purpureum TaxID=5786 RepID=F0ZY27_DICPU|nr:uncharacterized protein DICPUDRAFT_157024 [Dictyostelium purpureum]EGC31156.1 hypothetical protein DICPUDRAFT_157024 [Dictyostelium purpureum]|eukprot:XP_003292322.1 hypothetical protein DICPUDRAFT_157024 [Dictyostelium purpureum]
MPIKSIIGVIDDEQNVLDGSTMNTYNINLYYVLGIIDALLFVWALFQLIRIHIYSRNGVKNLKPKLIFHFIIAITMLVRSGFFFTSQALCNDFDSVLIWYELSSVLLFAGYGCLLLFWMELYNRFSKPYTTSKDFWITWRPRIIIFCTIIIVSLAAWIITLEVWGTNKSRKLLMDQIVEGVISGLFLLAGFGFLIYGILLFVSFKKLDRLSTGPTAGGPIAASALVAHQQRTSIMNRRRLLQSPPEAIRAAVVGSICTICFCIRSVITLYSIRESIDNPSQSGTTSFNLGWEFELAYFFITEILPTMLMMFRLRKMKRKKTMFVNDSHQNIGSGIGGSSINNSSDIITYSQYSPLASTKVVKSSSNPNIHSPLIMRHNYNDYDSSSDDSDYDDDESSSSSNHSNNYNHNPHGDIESSQNYISTASYKTTILPN